MPLSVKYNYLGPKDDYRTELIVCYNGVEIAREIDRGEPEDNSFGRDWSWIKPLLIQVYELGVHEGIRNAEAV